MTLLNWELNPDGVAILSDTLSLDGETRLPRTFMTKIHPAPHIGGVITGTGFSQFVTQFYLRVIDDLIVSDTIHLSEFATPILQELWSGLADRLPDDATSTIYTFGLSRAEERFVGIAYRSTADFEPERLVYGLAAIPAPEKEQLTSVASLTDFIDLALQQQAADRELARNRRIGIGGELWVYMLGKTADGSLTIHIQRALEMPHFENDHELMLAQLPQNKDHPISLAILAREQDEP